MAGASRRARGGRLRGAAARVGAVALGGLLALAVGEGLVRVAAVLDPTVRWLATARASRPAPVRETLEAFVRDQAAFMGPHRVWYAHWSNAYGFHDEEFAEPKPPGRFRILAVGASFAFGMVPYPMGVMTLTEAALRRACAPRDLDLLNLGVIGAGPREYRQLVELTARRFAADVVLVNVFAGNDGPDLHRHVYDRSPAERLLRRSRLWTFVKNWVRARGGVAAPAPAPPAASQAPGARGGQAIDASAPPGGRDSAALVGPILTPPAYERALAADLGRFYRPADPAVVAQGWAPTLAELDALRAAAAAAGASVALALLPSEIQVSDALRAQAVARLSGSGRYRGLRPEDLDPRLPNGVLEAYARARALPHADLTGAFAAARRRRPGAPLYKARDSHWTPDGNRVAADALTPFLTGLACPGRGPR